MIMFAYHLEVLNNQLEYIITLRTFPIKKGKEASRKHDPIYMILTLGIFPSMKGKEASRKHGPIYMIITSRRAKAQYI